LKKPPNKASKGLNTKKTNFIFSEIFKAVPKDSLLLFYPAATQMKKGCPLYRNSPLH